MYFFVCLFLALNFSIIDFIFPQVCGICEKLNKDGLCIKCKNGLEKLAKIEIIDMNKKVIHIILINWYIFLIMKESLEN